MKNILLYLCLIYSIFTNAQVKNLTENTTFYDFIDAYKSQNNDTIPNKHIQRLVKRFTAKLSPNGDTKIAANAINNYAQNYDKSINDLHQPNWEQLGPFNSSPNKNNADVGRIYNITFDPNYGIANNKTVYACTSFGGLWRSLDDGLSWSNLNTDIGLPISAVSDIVVHPNNSNILFLSTGMADGSIVNFGLRSTSLNPIFTIGVYRSTDLGNTWQPINAGLESLLAGATTIRDIEINPNNPNQIFIATSAGIYRTNNANDSVPIWQRVLQYRTDQEADTEFKGLEFKPNNPSTVYVSGQDIYKSIDSGYNWSSMTGLGTGLELDNLIAPLSGETESAYTVWRINITVTLANQDNLYAYIYGVERYWSVDDDGNPIIKERERIYIYLHNNTSWIRLHNYSTSNPFEALSVDRLPIAVSPINENELYYGTTRLYANNDISMNTPNFTVRSGYIGSNFHADIHSLEFPPNNSTGSILFTGHDGGISIKDTSNTSTTGWLARNNGLAVATIWSFDDSDFNKDLIIAGFQDDFTKIKDNNDWKFIAGGDGYGIQINDLNDRNAFYLLNTSSVYRYDYISPGGGSNDRGIIESGKYTENDIQSTESRPRDPSGSSQRSWIQPDFEIKTEPKSGDQYWTCSEINIRKHEEAIAADRLNPDRLWEIQSDIYDQYLDHPDDETRPQWRRQLNRFEISEANPEYRYIIRSGLYLTEGNNYIPAIKSWIYRVTNGLSQYTQLSRPGEDDDIYPIISDIALDPTNENRIFISYSSFNELYKVYYSEDAGVSWHNADPNNSLPNLPVNAITYQKGTDDILYVGTDAGVYVLNGLVDANGNPNKWEKYGNFPNVNVQDLKINYCLNKLRVSTFGRGMWQGDILPFNKELPEIVYNAGEHEIWEADVKRGLRNSVRIKAGASLTIKGEISMPQKARITVEIGGKLIIDGGKLSQNCDALWQGIIVLGNKNLPQTEANQGVVEINNGAIIEHAEIGVLAANSSFVNTGDSSETGGIVRIDNAIFRDNIIGVEIPAYSDKNDSYIRNSTFNTTSFLENIGKIPNRFISLYDVGTIDIANNTFINHTAINSSTNLADLPNQGSGIVSFNAAVNIKGNSFENLYKAIDSQGTNTRYCATRECLTTDIDNNNFINNWNAVYLNNNNSAKITSNDIQIFETFLATLADGSSGLYIVQSNGFHIENNSLHATGLGGLTNGIYIQDCDAANKIYKNYFDNLHTAIYALGKNADANPLTSLTTNGLQIICNEFQSNTNDIYIAPDSYIPSSQGSNQISAGNTFNPICTGNFKEFNNQGLNQITYIAEFPAEYQPNCNNNVNLFHSFGHNTCPSTLSDSSIGSSLLTSFDTSISQNKALLLAITDGGDTDGLNETVDDAENNEALRLRNKLLSKSPYLSDTVMVNSTTIETVLPSFMVKQILSANPKAAKSNKVQTALDNRDNQLPTYMREEINLGKNVLSYKEEVESSLSKTMHQRENIVNRLINKYRRDTVSTSNELSGLLIAESQMHIKRNYELANYYLSIGEMQNAQTTFTNILQNFNMSTAEQNEYDKRLQLFNLKKYVIENNKTWYQLTQSQKTIVNTLAVDSTSTAGMQARAILSLTDNINYGLPIPLIEVDGRASTNVTTVYDKFEVTPNQAVNYFIIDYALGFEEKTKEVIFEVYNSVGKKMISKEVKTQANQFLTECVTWEEGIYICKKRVRGFVIQEKSFVIKRDKTPINNNLIESFIVYPNPTDNHFFVDFTIFKIENTKVQITDAKGLVIKTFKINKSKEKIRINTSSWQLGVYFVTLLNNDKTIKTVKIVVK